MKMKYLMPCTILILFVSLPGCIDASDNQSNAQDETSHYLSEENNGMTIEVGIAKEIVIELHSNPSTGYHWENANPSGAFITQDGGAVFIEDKKCSGLVGCGGTERIYFTANEPGTGVISLVYHRSFEEKPLDEFRVDVVVTD